MKNSSTASAPASASLSARPVLKKRVVSRAVQAHPTAKTQCRIATAFITTSDFHKNALDDTKGVTHKIILINGQRLAELMIEHGIGVSTVRTIALKRVDSDYFEEA